MGPLLFVYKGFLVIFFVLQNFCFIILKKISKKKISQKKIFTERKFEKCCEAKKMHKGHISGRRKNFNQKKSKLKVWHSYQENSLNHTSETQKSVFSNFFFWEVFIYVVSTYCKLQFSLTKFLYTLLPIPSLYGYMSPSKHKYTMVYHN